MRNHSAIAALSAVIMLLAGPLAAATFVASPTGTANGDGSLTNPLSLQAAVEAAGNAGQSLVIALPGSYSSAAPLALGDILIKGSGSETLLVMDIRVEGDAALAELQVVGTLDANGHSLLVRDVAFAQDVDASALLGTWYGPDRRLRVTGLPTDVQPGASEAASWGAVTNYVAQVLARTGKMGKLSNEGGIYDLVYATSNALWTAILSGDISVSNFAIAYTDAAISNALSQGFIVPGTIVTTGDTLVVEAACTPLAPAGARKGARMTGTAHSVLGQYVTASRHGGIVFIDLAIEDDSPATIVVTSAADPDPATSIARTTVDGIWYRYELDRQVRIAVGDAYEIRFGGGDTINLDCIIDGFASGHAIIDEAGTDPGYDLQFRTLIYEYISEAVPAVQITADGIAVSGDATITMNGEEVTTRAYVESTSNALASATAQDYVKKAGDTMTGSLTVQGSIIAQGVAGTQTSVTHTPSSATCVNDSWTHPEYCMAHDGLYAELAHAGELGSLDITDWRFALPPASQVASIHVRFRGVAATGGPSGAANYTILINGVEMGGRIDHYWSGTFDVTDDWNIPLASHIVNAASFGVRINSDAGLKLDSVAMSVVYSPPEGEVIAGTVRLTQQPSAQDHAASVGYLETHAVTKSGAQNMVGPLMIGGVRAATVNYVGNELAIASSNFVQKSGEQTMQGPLIITEGCQQEHHAATKGYVDAAVGTMRSGGDWHIGTEAEACSLVMENDTGKLTVRKGTGNSLRLEADHGRGGQIIMNSPVSMPGKAGRVYDVQTIGGHTVSNQNCSRYSIVIVTPTSDNPPSSYSVTAQDGSFIVKSFAIGPDTGDQTWSFNYLIINQ